MNRDMPTPPHGPGDDKAKSEFSDPLAPEPPVGPASAHQREREMSPEEREERRVMQRCINLATVIIARDSEHVTTDAWRPRRKIDEQMRYLHRTKELPAFDSVSQPNILYSNEKIQRDRDIPYMKLYRLELTDNPRFEYVSIWLTDQSAYANPLDQDEIKNKDEEVFMSQLQNRNQLIYEETSMTQVGAIYCKHYREETDELIPVPDHNEKIQMLQNLAMVLLDINAELPARDSALQDRSGPSDSEPGRAEGVE